MSLPPEVAEEMRRLGASRALRDDLSALREGPARGPADLAVAADRAVDFVVQCNAFVNHEPRPFRPIRDPDIRL